MPEGEHTDLIGKPDSFRTALLLFVRILLCPFEQENETIDRPTKARIRCIKIPCKRKCEAPQRLRKKQEYLLVQ